MKRMNVVHWILMLAVAAFFVSGCAKKPAPTIAAPVQDEAPRITEAPPVEAPSGVGEQAVTEEPARDRLLPLADATSVGLQRIFFGFDQHTLTDQAREILAHNAEYLKENSRARVRIEGHCDNRGSDEYNLALGERRARAARDYLISLGIDGGRLSVISYGEEMPLDPRNNEEAWAKNRRAEFNVIGR